jgi:hypothetical protein
MLQVGFAGIDWASEEHACGVVDADGRIIEGRRYRHDERGIRALCARLLGLGIELVAVERPDGLPIGTDGLDLGGQDDLVLVADGLRVVALQEAAQALDDA